MSRKFIIGVNGGHKIGTWNIPRSVQSAVFHYAALSSREKISFIVSEYQQSTSVPNLMAYIKKNKKNIKKIIFVSIFQLGITKREIFKTLKNLFMTLKENYLDAAVLQKLKQPLIIKKLRLDP